MNVKRVCLVGKWLELSEPLLAVCSEKKLMTCDFEMSQRPSFLQCSSFPLREIYFDFCNQNQCHLLLGQWPLRSSELYYRWELPGDRVKLQNMTQKAWAEGLPHSQLTPMLLCDGPYFTVVGPQGMFPNRNNLYQMLLKIQSTQGKNILEFTRLSGAQCTLTIFLYPPGCTLPRSLLQ